MKRKSSFLASLLLAFVTLFVLGCGLASRGVSSPTSAAEPATTPLSTSAPVDTDTPTPEPSPTTTITDLDISSAVLTLEDLPAGFEELSPADLGISLEDFASEGFKPETVSVFINTQNLQMIFCFNFLLTNTLDRASFDVGVSQPDITLPALVGGMGSENVRDEKLLEGLDDIGEKQIGMTMVATTQGLPMQVDIVMFRREVVGGMIMSMYMEGQKPNITIHDLGSKLDQRFEDTLAGK